MVYFSRGTAASGRRSIRPPKGGVADGHNGVCGRKLPVSKITPRASAELIFACGGAMNRSVFAAAEEAGGMVIGSDIDQSQESPVVLTSAVKGLGTVAGQVLDTFYQGEFPGGKSLVLGAREGAVGLAMENSRFTSFTQADYETLLQKISEGEVRVVRNDELISPLEALPTLEGLRMDYQE